MKPLTELYFKVLLENIRIGFEVTDGDKCASLLNTALVATLKRCIVPVAGLDDKRKGGGHCGDL
jgi:hypothetical protein